MEKQQATTENKPLTKAQQAHLANLRADMQLAQARIEEFISYLAAEHDAPAFAGWTKLDPVLGFVREVKS